MRPPLSRTNCWEHKHCGREPGGMKAAELGVCPAATYEASNGFLGGRNGGRACVYVTGTFCSGVHQGTYRDKQKHCEQCDFYGELRRDHGAECSVLSFADFVRQQDAASHAAFVHENLGYTRPLKR